MALSPTIQPRRDPAGNGAGSRHGGCADPTPRCAQALANDTT